MRAFIFAVVCAAVVLHSASARAEEPAPAKVLAGFQSIDTAVQSIGKNECGITAGDVSATERAVLLTSHVKLNKASRDYLYVNVNVLPDCSAANVLVEFNAYTKIDRTGAFAFASIWNTGSLLSGKANMQQRVNNAVERYVREFVAVWSSVNP